MKLTLVISTLGAGGAERVLATLAGSWAEMGRQVTLVTTHDDGSPPFFDLSPGVKHRPILRSDLPGGPLGANYKRILALRAILAEENPDVIVSFLNYTNILVLLASLGRKTPVVISERLDPRVHRLPPVWAVLRRLLYPRASILVNQTEEAAQLFRKWFKGTVAVIPNPVNVPDPPRESAEFQPEGPFIAAMGRLHQQKGFEDLLQAMALVHRSKPGTGLVILGEGPRRQELEKLRGRLGLDGVVALPGSCKRPQDILARAELFVMSSVTEGFPNVLCEAMALGLPVISTDCPSGPGEIIEDGKNGRLVPVRDPQAMAAAILELLSDPASRRKLGGQAGDVVFRYSHQSVLEQWESVLISTRSAPLPGVDTPASKG
jgi:GalNAc-alpha-(1->4)-GalNAc-alpha-(1->3)-diNAcBac-PP-undecaprenol alpha-1,4-N-acetyl-D-galactosaminyltransferase